MPAPRRGLPMYCAIWSGVIRAAASSGVSTDAGVVSLGFTLRILPEESDLGQKTEICARREIPVSTTGARRASVRPRVSKLRLTGPDLRAEGVVEVGACEGTNILYVKTTRRLCLFYADQVASCMPKLSPWALRRAMEMIDLGHDVIAVSRRFGFGGQHEALFRQLRAVGLVGERSRPLLTNKAHSDRRAQRSERRNRPGAARSTIPPPA